MMADQNLPVPKKLRKTLSEQSCISMYVKSLDKMDEIIGNYYICMGRNDYDGKFKKFADENGLEDDSLADEFTNDDDPENCSYLDFDENQTFPFHEPLKSESERHQKLYKFLKYCYENGRHPLSQATPEPIFDDKLFSNVQECDYKCDGEFKTCLAVKRITNVLSYYDRLNVTANEKQQHIFLKLMAAYTKFFDDYIHLHDEHCHELEDMNNELDECEITTCHFTSRHHGSIKNINDNTFKIYVRMMDALHFYLYHCFDAGLRSKTQDEKQENEEKQTIEYFDAVFNRIKQFVQDKKHITKEFHRFSSKNKKFNIETEQVITADFDSISRKNQNVNMEERVNLYLDELLQDLQQTNMPVNAVNDVKKFEDFVRNEEYDTETVKYLFDFNYSQLNMLLSEPVFNAVQSFMKTVRIMSSSFCVGLRFYYWDEYKSIESVPNDEEWEANTNDHSGYNVCDLFVEPKYSTFKEEINEYDDEHIDMNGYNDMMKKVECYQATDKVKTIKASGDGEHGRISLHYNISKNQPLKSEHLQSIIMYTDFTDLCSAFSGSFRPKSEFETMQNIKKRNSKYYWFSKSLRECIECYGQCGKDETLTGPFFTGVDCVLYMPSFNIRLCSPTSTSTQIEVAMKFCKDDGMIIELNNPDVYPYEELKGFNVSWISGYTYEAERLFCGGYHFIKICSVRITNTNENLKTMISLLYYLDTMITGGIQKNFSYELKVKNKHAPILNNLFEYNLKPNYSLKIDFHPYISATFTAFAQHKQEIILHLPRLYNANNKMRDLIMYEMEKRDVAKGETESERPEDDSTNLFRQRVFGIFKNATVLIIKTTNYNGDTSFSVSLIRLLSLIEFTSLIKIDIRAVRYKTYDNEYNWIKELCNSSSMSEIKKRYNQKNYSIELKIESRRYEEHWLQIRKKN